MKSMYLSPSLQKHNIGYGNYGTEELRMNQLCDVLQKKLSVYPINVYKNGRDMSMSTIVSDSNNNNVDLHLALHSNAGGGRGCEILVFSEKSKAYSYAQKLYKYISLLTPSEDRGIKTRPDLYELKNTKSPAIIVEIAFHDNQEDAKFIMNSMEQIATALLSGILECFNIPIVSTDVSEVNWKDLYISVSEKQRALEEKYNKVKTSLENILIEFSR